MKSISVELTDSFDSALEFRFFVGDLGALEAWSVAASFMEVLTEPPRLLLKSAAFESCLVLLPAEDRTELVGGNKDIILLFVLGFPCRYAGPTFLDSTSSSGSAISFSITRLCEFRRTERTILGVPPTNESWLMEDAIDMVSFASFFEITDFPLRSIIRWMTSF